MKTRSKDALYQIALTRLPGVGDIVAKQLVSYAGGVEAIFKLSERQLLRIPLVGKKIARAIVTHEVLEEAAAELAFVEEAGLQLLFYLDEEYPWRLKHSMDSPVLLYYKGTANLNTSRIIGVVGTRNNTDYGKMVTEKMLEDLAPYQPLVVSGLAYGIDITAHRACLKYNLPTLGVVAHGLDAVYPYQHRHTAEKMLEAGGGLLTEFPRNTRPNRENFPRRNRIVAGMVDALVVVESAVKGGALITAELAHSYQKEVFAVPGRLHDAYSAGCNQLLRQLKASIFVSGDQLAEEMGWQQQETSTRLPEPTTLPLNDMEQSIYRLMQQHRELPIDKLVISLGWPVNKVSATLLALEFKGLIRSLPGSRFALA